MIGSLIAAWWVGKRPIKMAIIFWIILLIAGYGLAAFALGEGGLSGLAVNFFIGLAIFIGLAMFYLKVNFYTAGYMYIVALIINLLIGIVSGASFGLFSFLGGLGG